MTIMPDVFVENFRISLRDIHFPGRTEALKQVRSMIDKEITEIDTPKAVLNAYVGGWNDALDDVDLQLPDSLSTRHLSHGQMARINRVAETKED